MRLKISLLVKRLLAAGISFALSFAMSVSVSAVVNAGTNYCGLYDNRVYEDSFISISGSSITVFAYYDQTKNTYLRGSTSIGMIDATKFEATLML